ncbi:MAG: ribonuclease P protein component [Pseudomonadota bacterium]
MAGAEAPEQTMLDGPPRAGFSRLPATQKLETLTKRADFLRAARGPRVVTPGFILQIRDRHDDAPPRVGFTCSKKVGNAVARNRAKRRLREIARLEMPGAAALGHDYVLIGRAGETARRDFAVMRDELRKALAHV